MSWQSDNSVKRIFNSFKRLKNQIFSQDVEALKQLKEELDMHQQRYVNDNILFLKLLSIHLKVELDYYKDINTAKQNIHKALNLPLNHHTELLKMSLKQSDTENYFDSIGLSLDNKKKKKKKKDEKTEVKDEVILNNNQKEILEQLSKVWDSNKVEKSLYNTANEFLKDVNCYS